jgi:hypothetical protein
MQGCRPGEAIPATGKLIHDIQLHPGPCRKIRPGSGRGDVEEEEAGIIPDPDRPFGDRLGRPSAVTVAAKQR